MEIGKHRQYNELQEMRIRKKTQEAVNLYISVSDVEYLKKDPRINWSPGANPETQAKLKELKETGSTQIVMSQLFRKEKREEENLGGEIGFDYKINDSDLAYVKYERLILLYQIN